METSVRLGVYRRLDNRFEGLDDQSPRALELHHRRQTALHSVFDTEPQIQVTDWGDTDDVRSHEFVELALTAAATSVFHYGIVPGVQWLGKKLAEKAVDTAFAEIAKALVAKLRPKQEAKELLDITITLPDGTRISVDPPDRDATIRISFSDGSLQSIEYSKSK